MPRKKSVSGRARGKTIENRIVLQAEKLTKGLRSLRKAGYFGKYTSKELFKFISRTPSLKLKKSRGSKRHRVIVSKIRQTYQANKLIQKKLGEFLQSRAFRPLGIRDIRETARAKAIKTLEEQTGKKVSEEDLDKFIELSNYVDKAKQGSILEKVDPSDFNQLVNTAKDEHWSESQFARALGQLANIGDIESINNEYMRKEAIELYYKYVV